MHGIAIAAVASVVISAQFSSLPTRTATMSKLGATSAGLGSMLDATASADVAAKVATQANLLVSNEATQEASHLNAQVALAGDEDSLAKRQVISTAQTVRHGIASYSVQDGDTVSTIAQKFNITTDTVRWANGINSDGDIKPGQALKILPISGVFYTVASGDTAETLAGKYQASAAQILEYNDADVKGLQAGKQIIIPEGQIAEAPVVKEVTSTKAAVAPSGAPSILFSQSFGGGGYAFGYCTYYVASRRSVPGYWGNANAWYYNAQASGFGVGSAPRVGAIAWTGAGSFGHVAYVEGVSGGSVTISEMNYNGNWNRVTSRTVSAGSFRYIY